MLDLVVLLVRVVDRTLWPNGASGDSIRVGVNVDTPINICSRAEREEGVGAHVAVVSIRSDEVWSPRRDRVAEVRGLVRCDVGGDDENLLHPSFARTEGSFARWWS